MIDNAKSRVLAMQLASDLQRRIQAKASPLNQWTANEVIDAQGEIVIEVKNESAVVQAAIRFYMVRQEGRTDVIGLPQRGYSPSAAQYVKLAAISPAFDAELMWEIARMGVILEIYTAATVTTALFLADDKVAGAATLIAIIDDSKNKLSGQ